MSSLELEPDPSFVGWMRPHGWWIRATSRCSACDAPIAWAVTTTGRSAPLDRDGVSHFATCPDADRFRRIRASRPPGAS